MKERDSSRDHHREHRDRDREHRSRDERSKDADDRHHGDRHRDEDSRARVSSSHGRHRTKDYPQDIETKRDRSREPESRSGREGTRDRFGDSVDRVRLRDSVDRDKGYGEESVERRSLSSLHKRKEYGDTEDGHDKGEKRKRISDRGNEEKREKRRFKDEDMDNHMNLNGIGVKKERREGKYEDLRNEEEVRAVVRVKESVTGPKVEKKMEVDVKLEDDSNSAAMNGSGFTANGDVMEPPRAASKVLPDSATAESNHSHPTKVSSLSRTNENKGVSVTRSHEVHGKSSTDGTTTSSAAGKGGSLSLDALAKAKRALQMQKVLSEKLKKISLLNKSASSSSDGNTQVNREGPRGVPSLGPSASSTLPVGVAASVKPPANSMTALAGLATIPNIEAVKRAQELAAKMGFHQDPEFGPLINLFPGHTTSDLATQAKPAKAPVLRLDALGREIDENGNVINMSKPTNLSTLKVNINKQKKEAFQILRPELDTDTELNPHFDARMGVNKTKFLRPKRMNFQFVEEGRWSKQAEIIRFKSQFGEAQAKELKTKQVQLAKARAELADINPNLIEVSERVIPKEKPKDPIPDTEWWDVPLLLSGSYSDIVEGSINEDKLKTDKITIYVEHPLPIEPPAEAVPPMPQPLKLTKRERKKLRTQRRLAKEKDRQEMIRQGLIEPPKPKVKMSNLMKVLGSEATQDPTRLEMEIRSAAAEREQAHVDRNIARKLTPAERREKKERKLFDDPNTFETSVSIYKINDLSHPKTRFKVDVNAQENKLSGCAVLADGISVVTVEGGSKSIKRYRKLMLGRINWAAAVSNEEEGGENNEDAPVNKCVLVWEGSVAKPSFNKFLIHQCRTEAAARKVFADAGVGHYWDLAVNFSDDQI